MGTGLAEFASMDQEGRREANPCAPYALVFLPPAGLRKQKVKCSKGLIDQLSSLQTGDVLYDVYAVPEPLATKKRKSQKDEPGIWRVGQLVLCTPFTSSALGDKK